MAGRPGWAVWGACHAQLLSKKKISEIRPNFDSTVSLGSFGVYFSLWGKLYSKHVLSCGQCKPQKRLFSLSNPKVS